MNNTVAIIGAGPAGIATAIQCRRQGIEFMLFEQNRVGGLLNNANLIENYPGLPDGISGSLLVERFSRQLSQRDISVINEKVKQVDYANTVFNIATDSAVRQFQYLVLATGTVPGQSELTIPDPVAEAVFYEIFDIIGVENKKIVIIGAGDAAFDYALNLAQNNQVTIMNRGSQTKCLPLLYERAMVNSKISYLMNTSLREIRESDGSRIQLVCSHGKSQAHYDADYLVFAIGRYPNDACLEHISPASQQQLVEQGRLYFVGDFINNQYRQSAIAAGNGIQAAMQIGNITGNTK